MTILAARLPAACSRAGFERMVAEVCLGKVGAVAPGRSRASPATAGTGNS